MLRGMARVTYRYFVVPHTTLLGIRTSINVLYIKFPSTV